MPTLISTSGGSTSNSYSTLAEISTYLDAHPFGHKWATLSEPARTRIAIYATLLLETHVIWSGTKATEAQALSHPRTALYNRFGELIADTVIAPEVKRAQAELCRFLAEKDPTNQDHAGITSISTPAVSLSFNSSARDAVIPPVVATMVAHLGSVQSAHSLQVRAVRV